MCNLVRVDQKGRLVTSHDGNSVRIYPMPVWNQVEERLEHLCLHNRNNQKLLARMKYFGRSVNMDKQGRVLIPIGLRSSAKMKGAVDVFEYLNYLEVWNHTRFLKNLRSRPITPQDEKTLNKLSFARRFPWAIRWTKDGGHAHEAESRFRVHGGVHQGSRGQAAHAIRGTGTESRGRTRVA